jgi:hypothetical protein
MKYKGILFICFLIAGSGLTALLLLISIGVELSGRQYFQLLGLLLILTLITILRYMRSGVKENVRQVFKKDMSPKRIAVYLAAPVLIGLFYTFFPPLLAGIFSGVVLVAALLNPVLVSRENKRGERGTD